MRTSRYTIESMVQPPSAPGATGPDPGAEPRLDLLQLGRAVWRRRLLVALTVLVVAGTTTAYTLLVDPVYETTSIVAVDRHQRAVSGVITLGESRALSGEVGFLRNSLELAERVAARLREAAGQAGSLDAFPLLRAEGDTVPSARPSAQKVLSRLRFQPLAAEEMISITAQSTSPREARLLADLYADEYQRLGREKSRASLAAARSFLEEQVDRRHEELARLEDEWISFARANRLAVQGVQGEQLAARYTSVSGSLESTLLAIEQDSASLVVLEQRLEQAQAALPHAMEREQEARALEEQIEAVDVHVAGLLLQAQRYYSYRPDLVGREGEYAPLAALTNQVETLRSHRANLSERLIAGTRDAPAAASQGGQLAHVLQLKQAVLDKRARLRELHAQAAALRQRHRQFGPQLAGVPRQAIERERIERKRSQLEQWYGATVEQLQQTLVAEEAELGYVTLVRSAMVPAVPVRPDTRQNLLLGLLLGLGLGVGLALVREAADLRYTAPEDLQHEPYPLLGAVPRFDAYAVAALGDGRANGTDGIEEEDVALPTGPSQPRLITLLNPWSPISEHYRLIRTRLQYAAARIPMRTILVSSPALGDGKSVTAANLAVVMAQSRRRTLLIDADMRRPTAHMLLGTGAAPGLGELLTGRQPFEPNAWATPVEGLSFIPAGTVEAPPSELLGGPAMRALMAVLEEHFDVILIDTPPVLAVSDAVTLAPLCDAAITVVSAGRTRRPELAETQEALAAVGTRVSGVVLTHWEAGRSRGAGYRYGDGYATETHAHL